MQRVTNCILINNGHVLLLKKPRRGWYAIPGGKMEQNETIKETVIREFLEETALNIHHPELAGAFTFSIFSEGVISDERSEEHTSELQSRGHLVCRLLLEKKKNN